MNEFVREYRGQYEVGAVKLGILWLLFLNHLKIEISPCRSQAVQTNGRERGKKKKHGM